MTNLKELFGKASLQSQSLIALWQRCINLAIKETQENLAKARRQDTRKSILKYRKNR